MATAPRPGAGARKEAEQAHITFELDGRTYTVRPGEVTASLAGEFRRNVGMSFRAALGEMSTDADLDTLRAMVWVALRQAGDRVTLDEVPDFTYETSTSLRFVDDPVEDGDSPEA